jgi:hypothetical protein
MSAVPCSVFALVGILYMFVNLMIEKNNDSMIFGSFPSLGVSMPNVNFSFYV